MELGLVQLIEQLKAEIGHIQLSSPSPMFTIEGVDLELKFVVEKSIDAGGKAHWVLFAAEAKGQYKDQQVNTIKLALKPLAKVEPGFLGAASARMDFSRRALADDAGIQDPIPETEGTQSK